MAFVHSKSSRLLANAAHLSGSVSAWGMTHSRALGPAISLLSEGTQWIPGPMGGSISIRGMFNSAAGDIHEVINAAVGVDNGLLVTVLPAGLTVGEPALMAPTDIENYTVDASAEDTVMLEVSATPDDGVDMGVILHALTARTSDANGTTVDQLASSAGGAVGVLHATEYTGLTSILVKIQHSTDGSVWSDLISFTSVTAVGAERVAVTGTVNRYVRATWDVTGTGSATFAVVMARR